MTRFTPPWAALKASVGKERFKCFVQASTACLGTKSILFSTNTSRLPAPETSFSRSTFRQAIGSLASKTSMITSADASTLRNSTQNLFRVFSASLKAFMYASDSAGGFKSGSPPACSRNSEPRFCASACIACSASSITPAVVVAFATPTSLALRSRTFLPRRCLRKLLAASFVKPGLSCFLPLTAATSCFACCPFRGGGGADFLPIGQIEQGREGYVL
mmetsp:Transcript_58465/g.148200  ORF Transcript_58465/g.148200 Transcript_58465/m.148200 type:complete len:218 (+) Transcript_58465:876-1529(+)